MKLPFDMPLFGGAPVPFDRFKRMGFDATAQLVHRAQVVARARVALFSRRREPAQGDRIAVRHAGASEVDKAENGLGLGVAGLRNGRKLPQSRRVVPGRIGRYALGPARQGGLGDQGGKGKEGGKTKARKSGYQAAQKPAADRPGTGPAS